MLRLYSLYRINKYYVVYSEGFSHILHTVNNKFSGRENDPGPHFLINTKERKMFMPLTRHKRARFHKV